MFCRKCLAKGRKVNMTVDAKEKQYKCPACDEEIEWDKQEDNE